MPGTTVLVVEDDPDILNLVSYNLRIAGFSVLSAPEGHEALGLAKQHLPDLIVLDLMIPGLDGFEVCKELKKTSATRNIPIIMLTARGEEIDRIVGLELGADDYMVKPFSPRELILRIRAVLRRTGSDRRDETLLQKEGIQVSLESHKVWVEGNEVILTATEFKLLVELLRAPGKVHTRDQLLDKVWGYHFEGYARTVDTHVRRLRQKLGVYSEAVETVRGVGYRFRDA
ncbi:MAG TPA: response regulator [Syntrophobacteraceae bacterium]|nr:response regulator [Syntrophobacteraceae bacterium]